jgi:AraC-like DNA-binding protein/quercetin dioxygenase-like cupin family protein
VSREGQAASDGWGTGPGLGTMMTPAIPMHDPAGRTRETLTLLDRAHDHAHDGRLNRGTMTVTTHSMRPGSLFDRHKHVEHQVAWAPRGVLTVATEAASWVLPPSRALWIPAGLPHETRSDSIATTVRSVFVLPSTCAVNWTQPMPIAARPLLAELIGYLEEDALPAAARARAEAVLLDLLEPVPMHPAVKLRMPVSEPARRVAAALADDLADRRTLEEWGRAVGASSRTLARAFVAETGVSFGRWRTLARLHAALPALAEGAAVNRVAARVGYESTSAFVAAFRRETGLTPAAYFRADSALSTE